MYSYVSTMESIRVIDNSQYNEQEYQSCTLLDQIVLDCIFHDDDDLKICYFRDSGWTVPIPIFDSFKRVAILSYNYDDVSKELMMHK